MTKTPDLVDVAAHAEDRAEAGKMDSFPEEGTDEKIVKPGIAADAPLSDSEAVEATKKAIQAEANGGGDAADIVPSDDMARASPT